MGCNRSSIYHSFGGGDPMNTTRNTIKAPAMTREEWQAEAEDSPGFAHFLPYERCKRPETIKPVAPPDRARGDGYKYFTEGNR
jgi:hypothetical protein